LNENYARELMELHTLGVDGGYTQKDVVDVARCLTGWTIDRPQRGGGFAFTPQMHDFGKKVVLGRKIRSGHGMEDGLRVLHLLAHHPSTAHFISLKLCRRFVADDPPPSLVDRAAHTFLKSKGDVRAVLKTILISPEFYSQAAYRAKVKSPLELVASSMRALGADTDASFPLLQFIARMGQPMFQYQAPTGFPDRASTWINSGALLMRMNFAMMLASNRIPGTRINLGRVDPSIDRATDPATGPAQDDRSRAPVATDGGLAERANERWVAELSDRLFHGTLSSETREMIVKETSGGDSGSPGFRATGAGSEVAALLIASPDFQRR